MRAVLFFFWIGNQAVPVRGCSSLTTPVQTVRSGPQIAARFNMPKLYQKAVEITGQGMQYLQAWAVVGDGSNRLDSDIL